MIYLIHFKNLCKCYNVHLQTIIKNAHKNKIKYINCHRKFQKYKINWHLKLWRAKIYVIIVKRMCTVWIKLDAECNLGNKFYFT
jgi:hypothetical protein